MKIKYEKNYKIYLLNYSTCTFIYRMFVFDFKQQWSGNKTCGSILR